NLLKSKDINEARSIMVQTWRDLSDDKREQYNHGVVKFYSPVTENYLSASILGAITERLDDLIRNYITAHGKLDQTKMDTRTFEKMMHFKSLQSCIDPGESIGILAAQSIGESSTQITLNTFHFTGRGEMNVTLGVPHLRELLMAASMNVKTPTIEVPILRSSSALCKAKRLQRHWSRLLFSQVLTNLNIHEKLTLKLNDYKRTYNIEFYFDEIIRTFETYFIPRFLSAHIRDKITINDSNDKDDQQETVGKDDDEPINDEANIAKEKSNRNDEKEYNDDNAGENEADDEEEEPMQDNHNDNEQLNVSKIAIKEDTIDDDDDAQEESKEKTFGVSHVSKEEINDNDDNAGENEADDEEEEPMQDNHNDNEQLNVSKIAIKEDTIDDDDDAQGNLIFL
ncbi:unnamed protein product, partial [Rotaria sp. Silwood2]